MKQYWEVPGEVAVIATQLDPRLKKLRFLEDEEQISHAIIKLREIWNIENVQVNGGYAATEPQQTQVSGELSLLEDIFADCDDSDEIPEDEVTSYMRLAVEKKSCEPLGWWQDRTYFPILRRLAKKYCQFQQRQYQVSGCFLMQECTYLLSEHV